MNAIADPYQLAPLWDRVRAMFARAVAALGAAASIAALRCLSRESRRRIIAWLCPLEHIVRKLLLAEAAAFSQAERARTASGVRLVHVTLRPPSWSASLPARPSTAIAEECEPGGSRSNFDTSSPETWPASFSFALPRDSARVADAHAPRIRSLWDSAASDRWTPAGDLSSSRAEETAAPLRLARRFEALRRVLENPLPHAERLARLLLRAVRRFPEVARRFLFAPARTGDYDPADPRLSVDALSAAFLAPEAFSDSS